MNEQEKFFEATEEDLKKVDVLEDPLIPENSGKSDEDKSTSAESSNEEDGQPRNRRERRLLAKLQAERESSMFLAGKLEARTEAQKAITEEVDYLKAIESIYGNESPEATLATDLLRKAIVGARDDAEKRAYDRITQERQSQNDEESEAANELDSFIEDIEEEYNVTLNDAQERSYFQLLQKMSPKDKQGNVIEYADPHAVWEIFSEKLNKRTNDNSRVKDLSSRSMVSSGTPIEGKTDDDATARFLREQGII